MFRSVCWTIAVCAVTLPAFADDQPKLTKLPLTGLEPSKIFPDLCLYRYDVGTTSEDCQAFFDQGLGFFYSYVWMEAARSFETALEHDPECVIAWWGLSRALEKWKKPKQHLEALKKAQEKLPNASHREQQLITSRLHEFGLIDGVKQEDRIKEAAKVLDDLLTLHHDDQEAWFLRSQLAQKLGSGTAGVPYLKALLMINPIHPGATHELVHFYERWKKPALGWPYASKYTESSPGIPHAWHMQAHLATRLGKWTDTTDRSVKALEIERAYHEFMELDPKRDYQFSHHLEICLLSLVHDGRFTEAEAIQAEARKYNLTHMTGWFRTARDQSNWEACEKLIDEFRKKNKTGAAYFEACMWLDRKDPERAAPAIEVLSEQMQRSRKDNRTRLQYWETRGRYLVQTGDIDEGLKLLYRTVEETVNDFRHHSWGNGSYYMEAWGIAALEAGRYDVAEEAFLEAMAHDHGSVRGALGMEIVCRRTGRPSQAERFHEIARRCWKNADPGQLERLASELTDRAASVAATVESAEGE